MISEKILYLFVISCFVLKQIFTKLREVLRIH